MKLDLKTSEQISIDLKLSDPMLNLHNCTAVGIPTTDYTICNYNHDLIKWKLIFKLMRHEMKRLSCQK